MKNFDEIKDNFNKNKSKTLAFQKLFDQYFFKGKNGQINCSYMLIQNYILLLVLFYFVE